LGQDRPNATIIAISRNCAMGRRLLKIIDVFYYSA